MEVKKGYKKTKIGVIPEDWTLISVDKNFEFYQNNTYSRDCMNDESGKIQNIHYGDILIKYGSILDCDKENIPFLNLGISVNYSNRTVQSGDIIIADTAEDNTVGKAIEVINTNGRKVVSGLHTIFIRPHAGLFAKRYLGYFFNAPIYHDQLLPYIVGIKVSSISKKTIRNTMILHPSLDEQQAIATALSDVDNLINSLTKLINKKKRIKQGAMQELLTGKKRLDGFSGEWDKKTIDEISVVSRGRVISQVEISKSLTKKYPVYSSQTLADGIMGYLDTYDFDGDYITWTTDGVNAGTVFYRRGRFNCTNVCGTIKLQNHSYYFISKRLGLETGKYVSKNLANPKLMNDVMKKITVTFPCIEEQTAIANILSDMDAEIEALENKLNKYKNIKQGMMQELLTGRIRLV